MLPEVSSNCLKKAAALALLSVSFAVLAYGTISIAQFLIGFHGRSEVHMSFTGVGEVYTENNLAEISFTYSQSSENVSSVQEEVNEKAANVYQALEGIGIEKRDIRTTRYSVTPNYNYDSEIRRSVQDGYTLAHGTMVRVRDIEDVQRVLDVITRSNPTEVTGPFFTLTEESRREHEQDALVAAIANARAQAEGVARMSGLKLERLVLISRDSGDAPEPYYAKYAGIALESAALDSLPPVEAGENTIRSEISLTYSLSVKEKK